MLGKIFVILVIGVSLLLGIASHVLPTERLHDLAWMSKFFQIQVYVLGTGALIKYLCTWK